MEERRPRNGGADSPWRPEMDEHGGGTAELRRANTAVSGHEMERHQRENGEAGEVFKGKGSGR